METDLNNQRLVKPFNLQRPAFLKTEGIGINGSFSIRGYVISNGDSIEVSASGLTAAREYGRVNWDVTATLKNGGVEIESKKLKMNGVQAWSNEGGFVPIGSASLYLTDPIKGKDVSIVIEASYLFMGDTTAAPVPRTGKKIIQLISVDR